MEIYFLGWRRTWIPCPITWSGLEIQVWSTLTHAIDFLKEMEGALAYSQTSLSIDSPVYCWIRILERPTILFPRTCCLIFAQIRLGLSTHLKLLRCEMICNPFPLIYGCIRYDTFLPQWVLNYSVIDTYTAYVNTHILTYISVVPLLLLIGLYKKRVEWLVVIIVIF